MYLLFLGFGAPLKKWTEARFWSRVEKTMAPEASTLAWKYLPHPPMDGGAWKAAVHGVAKSRTRLSDLAAAAAEIVKGKRSFEIAHPIKT